MWAWPSGWQFKRITCYVCSKLSSPTSQATDPGIKHEVKPGRAASLARGSRATCLCWPMRGISMSWLGEAMSCRRCGEDAEAFCLFRHMQTRKKRQAMTSGIVMLGTRMYRIPILLLSRGPVNNNKASVIFQKRPPLSTPTSSQNI